MSTSASRSFFLRSFPIQPLTTAIGLLMLPFTHSAAHSVDLANAAIVTQPNVKQLQNNLQNYNFHRDHILGTSLDVIVRSQSPQQAQLAFAAIEKEIARLDQVLSIWRDDSEISALQRIGHIQASPDLFAVIAACERWRMRSCGGFDARLGQLLTQWQQANGIIDVTEDASRSVWDALQNSSIALDAATQQITLKGNIRLAPDGYAKGYIIDRALVAARAAVSELQGVMIDIGGDLRVWGQAPQQQTGLGWQVGVQDPQAVYDNAAPNTILNLDNQAVAVSGQGYRSMQDGQHHIINPQTQAPANPVMQCVVVGTCAADADALATALSALPPEQGLALVEQLAGYEARMSLANGEQLMSRGWNTLKSPLQYTEQQYTKPQPAEQAAKMQSVASSAAANWPAGYQAVLNLTIPKITAANYRAPYVSVWVTDADKKLVRTLAVWGKDEKWLNSNYVWWRRYGRMMEKLDAVAQPSRKPGNYRLAWDGRNDAGEKLPAGDYIVHIETAREHGEHSYQSLKLNVQEKASKQTLPAQNEMGAIQLNFQKVQ